MNSLKLGALPLLLLALAATPGAADGRNPASLLVFPYFEHNDFSGAPPGKNTLMTVTNTDLADPVIVHFVFVYEKAAGGCAELMNKNEPLAANDTFTFLTNPYAGLSQAKGYAYAFAVTGTGSVTPISFNNLIGDEILLDGLLTTAYAIRPAAFRAINSTEGAAIGMAAVNPILSLDNTMYERAPERVLMPRFMGQDSAAGTFRSELVVLSLAGGNQYETVIDFAVFNDNEEAFSAQFLFRCWTKVMLTDINGIFGNTFLQMYTNDDPGEIVGETPREAGWMIIEGNVANPLAGGLPLVLHPSVLAVLIERTDQDEIGAELPFLHNRPGSMQTGVLKLP